MIDMMDETATNPGMKPAPGTVRKAIALPWICITAIATAEGLLCLVETRVGLLLQTGLLLAVLTGAMIIRYLHESASSSPTSDQSSKSCSGYRLYLALALVPLSRVLALSLPLADFSLIYRYFMVGMLMLTAAVITMKSLTYKKDEVYLGISGLPLQLAAGVTGIPLGLIQFYILNDASGLYPRESVEIILSAAILIICTGFTEEFIFRGLLQRAATDHLGSHQALFYTSLLYASLHISSLSAPEVALAFATAMGFALLVRSTGSLWGAALSHGLANVTLLLCCPLWMN